VKRLRGILVLAGLLAIGAALWLWWQNSAIYPSTSNAYVHANSISIASEVSGRVLSVEAVENSYVHKGDLLYSLDPKLFRDAVTAAQSQAKLMTEAQGSYARQIGAAKAAVDSAKVARDTAANQLRRSKVLYAKGDVSEAFLDQARARAAQAQAQVDAAEAQFSSARSALVANRENLIAAEARLQTAKRNLGFTRITAPSDGWIANLRLRVGSAVTAFTPQFALVEDGHWWIDANFKETDLPRIKPGQPVSATIDMFPGQKFSGKVASLGRASGATFALLPAQNATGNWVKITQRFPVRIALDPGRTKLRAGASATVTVDTSGGKVFWWMFWR